jgi:hypothetical protein
VRGFNVKNEQSRGRLETVGKSFLDGFAAAAEADRVTQAEAPLERVPAEYRGFAYEGAAMAFAIRDALPVRRGHLTADLIAEHEEHVYMAYVGVGWAMARLPRPLWSRLYAPDPLLRWLVLDGYGFHQAYFKTSRYVHGRQAESVLPWPAGVSGGYAGRAIDQGIGRATWFVAGTDPRRLVQLFDRFAEHRRPDLYAGAGLAATYAGGSDAAELTWLRDNAGPYRRELAQGSAFGAQSRLRAGLVVPHNEVATQVFCGMGVQAAAAVTEQALRDLPADDSLPAYEIWRQRIGAAFHPAAVASETRAEK